MMDNFTTKYRMAVLAAVVLACSGLPVRLNAAVPQDGPQEVPAQLVLADAPASYLGINIRDIDEHGAKLLGLKNNQGVEVIAVDHDAPAGKGGIRLRDVIVTVDGHPVTSEAQFRTTMRGFPPGKEVELGVIRSSKPMKFTIKLADRVKLQHQAWVEHFTVPMPEVGNSFSSVAAMQNSLGDEEEDLPHVMPDLIFAHPFRIGAVLDPIGPQLAAFFGVKDGTGMLVKSVEPDGPAATAGLQAGDVILKLNDQAIVSPMDWMRAMQSAQTSARTKDKPMQLTIVRNKRVEVLTIAAPKTQARVEWPEIPPLPDVQVVQLDMNIPDIQIDADKLRAEMDGMKAQMQDAQVFDDGQLSPALQQQMQDAMKKATQQIHDFHPDGCDTLQPY